MAGPVMPLPRCGGCSYPSRRARDRSVSATKVGTLTLFRMARSRWEIENQGFNDCKSRQGFEHICHHEPHSLVICWLLTLLALVIGRLFRIRYLHRGNHPIRSAIKLPTLHAGARRYSQFPGVLTGGAIRIRLHRCIV